MSRGYKYFKLRRAFCDCGQPTAVEVTSTWICQGCYDKQQRMAKRHSAEDAKAKALKDNAKTGKEIPLKYKHVGHGPTDVYSEGFMGDIKYCIVQAQNVKSLEDGVTAMLNDGYKLCGNQHSVVQADQVTYYQPMIKGDSKPHDLLFIMITIFASLCMALASVLVRNH